MQREMRSVRAFVLHQHDWQDNGRVFELLTREQGRFSVFAHGVRGPKAKLAGVMQPFLPLLVSWSGRSESPRLIGAEPDPQAMPVKALSPGHLMPAFYLNELLLALTARHDPHPALFDHYSLALSQLRAGAPLERELRLFEKRLLDALGYGLQREAPEDEPDPLQLAALPAAALALLADERLDEPELVEQVRPLLRRALTLCLDGRALRTRGVARSLAELRRAGP